MVYLLYNFILLLSSLFLVPYYLVHGLRYGKSRRGIRERLGYLLRTFRARFKAGGLSGFMRYRLEKPAQLFP